MYQAETIQTSSATRLRGDSPRNSTGGDNHYESGNVGSGPESPAQALDAAGRLNSKDALERRAWLFARRAVPEHISSHNGSEEEDG